ncbi:hypothetical protein [Fusibacillus kribbianus]|uniref:DUF3221 domain-containing protein n=1 Tax=Fusibacillus kribbianus TaxID=3044208 RepID=A0AAP4BCH7_9FIRM|nr:hypothetical protein [Ruminococcus sp. YH-rum2234]MDI9242633.1 hypothetical protein [Ruminococcus sp. YH-rum2234]
MKKMRYLLVLFLALGMLESCGEKGNGWFDAEVIAVDEETIIVKPVDNPEAAAPESVKNADEIHLSLKGFGIEISSGGLEKGDKIRAAFNEDSVDEKAGIIKIVFQIYKYGDDGELTLVSNPIWGQVTEEIGVLEEYSSPK